MSYHKVKITAKTEDEGGGLEIELLCVDKSVCSTETDSTDACVVQTVWKSSGMELIVSDDREVLAEITVDAEWSGTGPDSELWLVVE